MLDIHTFYQILAGHLKMNIWPENFDKGERVVNEIIFIVCFDMTFLHLCRLICVLCKIYSGILNPWKSKHTFCPFVRSSRLGTAFKKCIYSIDATLYIDWILIFERFNLCLKGKKCISCTHSYFTSSPLILYNPCVFTCIQTCFTDYLHHKNTLCILLSPECLT